MPGASSVVRGCRSPQCHLIFSYDSEKPTRSIGRVTSSRDRDWKVTVSLRPFRRRSSAADALGVADQLGSVKSGMLADLIVVDGDPIQDIKVLSNKDLIKKVFSNGVLVKERA